MIQISSYHLTKTDISYLRKFTKFVLDKFVKRSVQAKCLIKIHVIHENDLDNYADIDDLKKFNAWVCYEGVQNDKKVFKIVLNQTQVNKKAKKPLTRLKKLIVDLGHELVHVKQYVNSELFDYVAGGVRYKGSYFDQSYQESEELYYESPWEIEAYGREWGLYKMFSTKMKGVKNN
jgi:hypothetical protein